MVCKVPNFRLSRVAAGICLTALPTIALAQDQSISSGLGFDISISDTPALQGVRTSGPAFSYPAPEFQVTFDGLSAERRLDLVLLNETAVSAGQTVRVQSQMNWNGGYWNIACRTDTHTRRERGSFPMLAQFCTVTAFG